MVVLERVVADAARPVALTVEARVDAREGDRVSVPSSAGKPLALDFPLAAAAFNAASEGRGVAGIAV